jgi:hypothetical protein
LLGECVGAFLSESPQDSNRNGTEGEKPDEPASTTSIRASSAISNPAFIFSGKSVNEEPTKQIVRGISLSPAGQATIDPALTEVLIDLAIQIDDDSRYPVDVEHVVAAVVLAAQNGGLAPETELSSRDAGLLVVLGQHIETVFEKFGGKVGTDD